MDTPEKRAQLLALAEEIFDLSRLTSGARARARTGDHVEMLTETESLTLGLLGKHDIMTVGEIQKEIGVLPAQMSRIVRSLENKGGVAYIECTINPSDRRKIDVTLTVEGKSALNAYKEERTSSAVRLLATLDPEERDEFMRILRKLRDNIDKAMSNK